MKMIKLALIGTMLLLFTPFATMAEAEAKQLSRKNTQASAPVIARGGNPQGLSLRRNSVQVQPGFVIQGRNSKTATVKKKSSNSTTATITCEGCGCTLSNQQGTLSCKQTNKSCNCSTIIEIPLPKKVKAAPANRQTFKPLKLRQFKTGPVARK